MEDSLRKQDERTAYLLGTDGVARIRRASVIVFGIGGVGSYCAEALARAGVGRLTLVDFDRVSESNINRQLVALHSTVGRYKTEVMAERIRDINPDCLVDTREEMLLPENADDFDLSGYDFVVDAVDTVAAKVELAVRGEMCGVPVVSCMGAGNKLDPTQFTVTDIYETSGDPLARVMRNRLRKAGVKRLIVVSSREEAHALHPSMEDAVAASGEKRAPGSLSFVPSTAGLVAASVVLRAISGV